MSGFGDVTLRFLSELADCKWGCQCGHLYCCTPAGWCVVAKVCVSAFGCRAVWIISCIVEALIPRKDEGSYPHPGSTLMSSGDVRSGWCLGALADPDRSRGRFRRVGEGAGGQPRDSARLGPPDPDRCRREARHHQVWRPSASRSWRRRSGSLGAGARSVGARRLFYRGGM